MNDNQECAGCQIDNNSYCDKLGHENNCEECSFYVGVDAKCD